MRGSRRGVSLVLLAYAGLAAASFAEVIPGRNVNMVSGTDWPGGDPFLQRQNEGSVATSTRNPLHLLAGGNDYRTVDIPGLPQGRLVGDAWHGLFWSRDGGHRWNSTLLPGYPQDNSPEGLASPLKGLEAGADAVLRSGTNGLVYYAGIAFNRAAIPENARGTGKEGKLFVARFIDDNAKETGNPFRPLGISVAGLGDEELFLDKPWLAVDVPRSGAGTCVVPGSGEIPPQQFKAGNVYLSYTAVSGDAANLKTRLFFTRSRDCGQTWSEPVRLTDGTKTDQGTVIAVHPLTGWVYVAWRRIDPVNRTAAFLLAISIDGGRSFSKPITIETLRPWTLEDGVTRVASVFEQGTSIVSFRTTGFPALTVDALGIVYAAWSERGVGPEGDARIVVKRSPGGLFWWWKAEPANRSAERGHELMPSLLYHGGKILLVHYTLAEDHTVGVLTPAGGGAFTETRQLAGDLAPPGADPTKVFREFVADTAPGGLKRRHTMDVWVREARPALCDLDLDFTSRRVSQYVFGDVGGADAGTIKQLQFNPPNLPLYQCQGDPANCVAFIGDYVDVAGAAPFVPKGTAWTYNLDPRPAGTAHVVWTDNRDVRPPPPGKTWADYTPPFSPFSATLPSQSLFDPAQERPECVPGAAGFTTAGMRNQNLYTSRLTAGLVVASPQNAKPLGFGVLPDGQTVLLQRSFVVSVQNTSEVLRTFRLTIRNQPPDGLPTGKASFLQFPAPGLPDPLTELFVNVGARSSATRTVFVTSTSADAAITVAVEEATAPGGDVIPPDDGGLLATVVLNPDITNPDITNPDITNPDITNPDITNAEVYNPDITNPDITNPDITNPDITNPDITNPDITNPDITNPDITNVQVLNPDITNPDITNPDITNPDITNPDITNPDITNVGPGSYTDATWTVQDNGNTSAAYRVKLLMDGPLPPGFQAQLILHKGYSTPVAVGCDLAAQRQSIVIANIPDPVFEDPLAPDITNPDITNPDITNATLFVAPGDDWVQVTLRLFDPVPGDGVTAADVLARITPAIVAQAVNTIEAAAGSRTPPVAVPDTTVVFTQPPSRGTAGVPLSPPVQVQVRDNAGAVVPGALVTLSLAVNPSDASLDGSAAVTDAVGVAVFPELTVDRAGAGYRLRASVGELSPAFSAPFTILEACAADGAPSVSSYAVEGPDVDSRPLASREAADFDGDGDRDLAVIHGDGTITKMAGNGLGAFERAYQFRVATTKTPRALAAGDLNEDGLSDLVVAYADSSQLGVVLSDRSPQAPFFTATPFVLALAGGPSAVATGDVNGDGNLDVVATLETADAIAVLLGDGAGGLGPAATFPAGNAPMAVALGRFDADGALDAAVVHYPDDDVFLTGSVSVLSGDGLGGFSLASTTAAGVNPASIAAGDLDGDGRLDVAVANTGGNDVTVHPGNGAGGFGDPLSVPVGPAPSSVAVGDFDADGRLDLATANPSANAFALVFGNGDGGFSPARAFAAGSEPVDVSAGDFNADGRTDLVVTNRLHQGACCDEVSIAITTCGATTAEVSVGLQDAPDPVAAGGDLTYTAHVTNKGPFAATAVELTQSVPGDVQAASPSAGTCSLGPPVVCDLGRLEPGQIASVTVVVTAPAGASSVLSRATVRAAELDRFPADNTAVATTAVQSGPRLLAVTHTDDSGPGSLRQALQDSNANAGVRDTIVFAIPGEPPHTIATAAALPEITDPVVIDATADGCTSAPPRVVLDGSDAGTVHGLVVLAGGTTLRGLAVNGFEGYGILLQGGGGSLVECSYLGVAPDGVTARPNSQGVVMSGSGGNTVGGTTAAARNVISGNVNEGVYIVGPASTGNVVAGNHVGTTAAGDAALGNATGVLVSEAPSNVVGGLVPGAGNVISANFSQGVRIVGAAATGNVVARNLVGTDAGGKVALGNWTHGVEVLDASGNQVGGRSVLARNVVSGNRASGVRIAGAAADNVVQGNLIGTDASGTGRLGNAGDGVVIDLASSNTVGVVSVTDEANVISGNAQKGIRITGGSATGNVVNDNRIGTDEAGQLVLGNALSGVSLEFGAAGNAVTTNQILFNGESGIALDAGAGAGNLLRLNRLRANGGLGIDLGGDGPTPNDPGDDDVGPNNLQNAMVLSGASTTAGGTRIHGSLQTTSGTPVEVTFFLNAACDPSGFGEADGLLTTFSGAANTDGFVFLNLVVEGPVPVGSAITALVSTAAGAATPNDTSELSNCVTVVDGTPPDGFTKVWVGGTTLNEEGWTAEFNWSPQGMPSADDDVYIQPAPRQPVVNVPDPATRNLTVAAGASLALAGNTLTATGDVDVSGTMSAPGTLRMMPPSLGSLRGKVPGLKVEGLVMPGPGSFTVEGDVEVVSAGLLDPANEVVIVGGDLSTTGTGILRMTPGALLDVGGDARFNGGSTDGQLISGTLRVGGDFVQGNATSDTSFAASANHLTVLTGVGRTVSFASPGSTRATSHFAALRLDIPGDLTLLSDVHGVDRLETTGPVAPIVVGGGRGLFFQGLNVFRLLLDGAPLTSTGGTLSRFDDVTFQRFGAGPPLTIVHPGPEQPFPMTNLDFGPTAGVESLLQATDSATADGLPLSLQLGGASPQDGCPLVQAFGGALVVWNGAPCAQ